PRWSPLSVLPLHGGADEHQPAVGAGHRALHQDEALLRVDPVHLEVLHGLAGVAHTAGHPHALEHAAGRGAAADRTGLAVHLVRTVRGLQAGEAVPLHDTGEALALGLAGDVDQLAGLERVGGDLLAEGVLGGVGGAHLDVVPARGQVVLAQVVAERLVDLARVDLPVAELDGGVAVGLRGPDARHDARTGLQDRHGHDLARFVEDLGHAELLAQDSLDL